METGMTPGSGSQHEQVRAMVHGMWDAVAEAWSDRADLADVRLAPVTEAMFEKTKLGRADRVLELACGPGGVGLAAAHVVGTEGEVVLSDVAPAMVAAAARRLAKSGLKQVRTAVLDLEQIAEPDSAYDVVLCREGLMFAVDPDGAVAEMHRVLRPGGWAAVSVWGAKEANPWLGVVFDGVRDTLGIEVPPPGVPGPLSLGDPDRLRKQFEAAGFVDISLEALSIPLQAPSFEAWWDHVRDLAGPLAVLLANLPDAAAVKITDHLRIAVARYASTDGRLELPGEVLLVAARRMGRPTVDS
jgi:ubiquinone/menaquinone biosynthesis C-methylase UbiE